MKFTNETLLTHYLYDLTLIDTTHNNKIKNKHPEYWNVPSFYKKSPIIIDPLDTSKNIWFWSDIHFFHKNIIRYSNRPFPNLELMNECLIGNARNIIKPGDIVIWGGDISFGHIHEVNEMIRNLPGYHIQIIGNHDMDNHGKLSKYDFDERHPCLVLDVIDHDIEYQILITHYPLDIVPDNCINFHGHIHQHLLKPYNINFCVEHTNYSPIHIKELMERSERYLRMKI